MISLIVVDYNSIKKSLEYVETFAENCTDQIHYIIIDNFEKYDSTEVLTNLYGMPRKLETQVCSSVFEYLTGYGKLIYCWSGANLGYARGNNLGSQIVDEVYEDEYYIFSNNDIRFQRKFDFMEFQNIFESNLDIAVVGPHIIGLDGKEQSPQKKVGIFKYLIAGYWFKYWPFCWKPDYDYTNESKYCYRVMGSFFIILAKAFRKAGRFDPNTFMFAEEMILSERLLKIGYSCYFYNDFTVIHEHGVTVKKEASILRGEQWSFESCYYYFEKYRETSSLWLKLAKINFSIHKIHIIIRSRIKRIIGYASKS